MNGDSVYDIYYSDEDLSPDDIISSLKDPANQEDLTVEEKYWMDEYNPEKFFWEYNKTKEHLLGKTDEIVQRSVGRKKRGVVETAIDTSMALAHKSGSTNLRTGSSSNVRDSLHQEVNLSTDRLKSSGKLSRIKTGQKINKLRSRFLDEREQQREDYLIARWEGGVGYEQKVGVTYGDDPTTEEEEYATMDFGVVGGEGWEEIEETDYGQFTNFFSPSKWRWSDKRVKENIKYLNTSPSGHKVYTFNYIGTDKNRYKGVMAQDVLLVNKHAVKNIDGILHVDYSNIDVNMEIVNG